MAAVSEAHSSSASDGDLIALLGQELYEDYFGTVGDGSILPHSVVGGASDANESQAYALESIVDNLLEASNAFENVELQTKSMPTEAKSRFVVPKLEKDVVNAGRASIRKPKHTQSMVCTCGMNGRPITTP